jgi:hypothetical protein
MKNDAIESLMKIQTPQAAYILGLIWADGSIESKYRVTIKMSKNDAKQFIKMFKKNSKQWTFHEEKRKKPTWKDQLTIRVCNTILCSFLIEHGYKAKSSESACKILSKIPVCLHLYWFRGLVDGDGSFQCGAKTKYGGGKRAFVCSASYNQDWTYFEKLLKYLEIKYKIDRRKKITKDGKLNTFSSIEFYRSSDIIKFGNWLYNGFPQDEIGLKRKYNKFQEIVKAKKKYDMGKTLQHRIHLSQSKRKLKPQDRQRILNLIKKKKTYEEIGRFYNVCAGTISNFINKKLLWQKINANSLR